MTAWWILAAVVILLVLVFFVAALSRARRRTALPYELRRQLLTAAERSVYGILQQAVGAEYFIFAKVRVADLLTVRRTEKEFQAHMNRILAKHIDFVLCRTTDVSPVLAIELDDSSHQQESRIERDAFIDSAFGSAGLPLLRIAAARSYDVQLIREQIRFRTLLPKSDT